MNRGVFMLTHSSLSPRLCYSLFGLITEWDHWQLAEPLIVYIMFQSEFVTYQFIYSLVLFYFWSRAYSWQGTIDSPGPPNNFQGIYFEKLWKPNVYRLLEPVAGQIRGLWLRNSCTNYLWNVLSKKKLVLKLNRWSF